MRYPFSSSFSDAAQQAMIAHSAMMMIRYFDQREYLADTRSIRNLILDRAVFKDNIRHFIGTDRKSSTTKEWI